MGMGNNMTNEELAVAQAIVDALRPTEYGDLHDSTRAKLRDDAIERANERIRQGTEVKWDYVIELIGVPHAKPNQDSCEKD